MVVFGTLVKLDKYKRREKGTKATVVVVRSLSQPLGYVPVGQLDFHIRCTRVSELISAVSAAKIPPHPSEVRRDVIISVFLGHHL